MSAGRVYIGSNTGVFYALNEAHRRRRSGPGSWVSPPSSRATPGASHPPPRWPSTPPLRSPPCTSRAATATCSRSTPPPAPSYGSAGSTAHAADANDYFDWSSPTVANGSVYIGVSSQCDAPAGARGRDLALRPGDGAAPPGVLRRCRRARSAPACGRAWRSPRRRSSPPPGNTSAGVLGGHVLDRAARPADAPRRRDKYTVPGAERVPDSDFGASPVRVRLRRRARRSGRATRAGILLHGADIRHDAAVEVQGCAGVAPRGVTACLAAGVWDGARLFLAGPLTRIDGVDHRGSVRRVDPATGTASAGRRACRAR